MWQYIPVLEDAVIDVDAGAALIHVMPCVLPLILYAGGRPACAARLTQAQVWHPLLPACCAAWPHRLAVTPGNVSRLPNAAGTVDLVSVVGPLDNVFKGRCTFKQGVPPGCWGATGLLLLRLCHAPFCSVRCAQSLHAGNCCCTRAADGGGMHMGLSAAGIPSYH